MATKCIHGFFARTPKNIKNQKPKTTNNPTRLCNQITHPSTHTWYTPDTPKQKHTQMPSRKARESHTITQKLAPFNPRAPPIAHRPQSFANGREQHRGRVYQRTESGDHRNRMLQELRPRSQLAQLQPASRKSSPGDPLGLTLPFLSFLRQHVVYVMFTLIPETLGRIRNIYII